MNTEIKNQLVKDLNISESRVQLESFGRSDSYIKEPKIFSKEDAKNQGTSELVCKCHGLTKEQILLEGKSTKAGTGCGSCKSKVNKILKSEGKNL